MVDLHTHTTFSDGSFTPTELVAEADRVGLKAIALCDHNTLGGLEEFVSAAKSREVTAIPGIEFSTEHGGLELHILGLFINARAHKPINDILRVVLRRKDESNRELVEKLRAHGYMISYDEILRGSSGTVNRANIAAELVSKGYGDSVWEIYNDLLSNDRGLYTPPERPDSLEIIELIRGLGAVPVLAHPFVSMSYDETSAFVPTAKLHGLVAMETRYSTYTEEQERLAEQIARDNGIEQSGGSDFHGKNKPDISLGTGKGELCVPDEFCEKLREYAR